jgi:hypothetical protein
MPNDVEAEIRARLEQFASQLTTLIQESAMSRVADAFSGGAPARRGRRAQSATPAPRATRGKKGQKRDPELLEALTEKLGAFITKNPGLRIEQIGKSLGVATKDLALPVKKLVAAKRVSTKGQKRATTYFSGGGRGKPGPKPGKPTAARAVKKGAKARKAPKAAKASKAPKAKRKAPAKRAQKSASAKKSVKPSAPPAAPAEASPSAAE